MATLSSHCISSRAENDVNQTHSVIDELLSTSIANGLSDRSYERRKAAALDLENLVKDINRRSNAEHAIHSLIRTLTVDFVQSTQANSRKGGLIALAAVAIGLMSDTNKYLDHIMPSILPLLHDQESRVRYYACEALFNVSKVVRESILVHFNSIYNSLCALYADPDGEVRCGCKMLNRLVQEIVSECITFNMSGFMPLLQERIKLNDAAVREFNVGWIQVLDSVPGIDILHYLPRILDGLFEVLSDKTNSDNVRAAKNTLHDFLVEIQDAYSALNTEITTKKCMPMLDDLFPLLVEQASKYGTLTALEWIHELTNLSHVRFRDHFPIIVGASLHCMNENVDEEIRAKAKLINEDLMQAVKDIGSHFECYDLAQVLGLYLEKPLLMKTENTDDDDECIEMRDESTRLATLHWIAMLLNLECEALLTAMKSTLFTSLIHILQSQSTPVVTLALQVLASIARSPSQHEFCSVFQLLVEAFEMDSSLLDYRGALIVHELSNVLGAETVYRSFAAMLHDEHLASSCAYDDRIDEYERYEAASRLVQKVIKNIMKQCADVSHILNMLLLTSSELFELRETLKAHKTSSEKNNELFAALFRSWCHNPVGSLGLCLLAQRYELGSFLVQHFAEIPVSVGFLIQVDTLVQLIESPIFLRLRLQILEPKLHPFLLQILYGLLMLLPQGKTFHALSTRLQSVSTLTLLDHQMRTETLTEKEGLKTQSHHHHHHHHHQQAESNSHYVDVIDLSKHFVHCQTRHTSLKLKHLAKTRLPNDA